MRLPEGVFNTFVSSNDETGRPHEGHVAARSDTDAAQSGQVKRAILPSVATHGWLVKFAIFRVA